MRSEATRCEVDNFQESRPFGLNDRSLLAGRLTFRRLNAFRSVLFRSERCVHRRQVSSRAIVMVRVRFYPVSVPNVSFVPFVGRAICAVVWSLAVVFPHGFRRNHFCRQDRGRPVALVELCTAHSFRLVRRFFLGVRVRVSPGLSKDSRRALCGGDHVCRKLKVAIVGRRVVD